MKFDPAKAIQQLEQFGEFGGVNPSITDSISKLDPKSISNASPRHIQSVLEDLIVVCLEGQILADKVLRLNPKSEEIGAGMLANLQEIAGKITKIY